MRNELGLLVVAVDEAVLDRPSSVVATAGASVTRADGRLVSSGGS